MKPVLSTKKVPGILLLFLLLGACATAPLRAQSADPSAPSPQAPTAPPKAEAGNDQQYSGMYTFLKEGEFVQVTVEDAGSVTGFVSRYGDGDSDKDAFLDQFFKTGKLDGNKLTFTTEIVHGVSFDFSGSVERGEGKNPGDEAYYVLKGTLTEKSTDVNKKVTSHQQDVIFRMFPQDAASPAPAKN